MIQNVLVTGATGFVGRHLCERLAREGAHVVGLARGPWLRPLVGVDMRAVDIADAAEVGRTMAEVAPEVVIHLAATRNRGVDSCAFRLGYEVNLLGTLNVMEASKCVPRLDRFIHLGTCEEYGLSEIPFDEGAREAPASSYGVSKLGATQLLQSAAKNWNLPVTILRPTNVYGPGQGEDMFLPALINALLTRQAFSMTPGEQTRDYVYVDDLVEAILCAIKVRVPAGGVVNIGSGQPIRMKEVALQVLLHFGTTAADLLSFDKDYRKGEVMEYWACTRRASQWLHWETRVALAEGIARTVASFRAAHLGS